MNARLRYVTVRRGKDGRLRWYWQRRGHPLTRLPENLVERLAMVEQLNTAADQLAVLRPAEPSRGTVGWVIAKYKASDEYTALAPGSLKYYNRFLKEIEALGPHLMFKAFTRQAVVDLVESYERPAARRQCASVLKNLFGIARYYGLVETDQTSGLRLTSSKPRERIWTDDEAKRWLGAAEREDPAMVTAFLLLQHTAQRPGDVLHMTWPAYSSTGIRLRQQKTKALLEVPVHPVLATHLDALPRHPRCLTIVVSRGRPVSYRRFNDRFRHICELVNTDAQARDLRRTAMVNMAIAGATESQIASVSGHTIEATRRILETYLPRNRELAQVAITRLADYQAQRRTEREPISPIASQTVAGEG
jgi:integrase